MSFRLSEDVRRDGPVRAIVAEDEPLLADALIAELQACWPELHVAEPLGDGESTIACLLNDRPDVAFLDIRMPGVGGLDVARIVHDAWSDDAIAPPPIIVFVTAYAEFAVQAFDRGAIDYLIKPVTPERLARTVLRIRERLHLRSTRDSRRLAAIDKDRFDGAAEAFGPGRQRLTRICAASGDRIYVIPVEDVLLFEADDKYVNVHARTGVMLIRRSLRDLLPGLDPVVFKQVHRRVIVNMTTVRSATRAGHGRLLLDIDGIDHHPPVSRAFAHLFRAM